MLILNNQSTVDLICNKKLVTRVWNSYESMKVKGNGGAINTTHKAYVKGYGDVCLNEQAITNILALKNVKCKFRVTYDSRNEGVFTVHKPSGQGVQFCMHKEMAEPSILPTKPT